MKRVTIGSGLLTLLVGMGISGCEPRQEGWTPVLEETSTAFLETETQRLLEHIRTAQGALATDPRVVERSLSEAEASLEHLTGYYIPLFKARESAYNAYRSLLLGDDIRLRAELGAIEAGLDVMAEGASGGRLQELQALAELLAAARLSVESGPGEGAPALERLARELNQAALKGDLVLRH